MIAPVIAVNPAYNLFLNNMTKTVLLSQLVYWDGRKSLRKDGELWFAKTSAALAEEIGHGSSKSIGDWLRDFKAMGLIRLKRGFFNGINQLWIQVSHDKLAALLAEFEIEHEFPIIEEKNLPQAAVTSASNLPETDSPTRVSYPTGNCTSKITSQKINDHREDDFSILTQDEIHTVTQRVTELVNSRKFTASPIRSPKQYLQASLKNESQKKQANQLQQSTQDNFGFGDMEARHEEFVRRMQIEPPLPKPVEFPRDETWDAVMERIADQWEEANFTTWLGKTHFFGKDETQYIIAVPNAYICDMLQYRLYDDIKTALCEITQRDLDILFEVKYY